MQENKSLTEWFLQNRPYARPGQLIAPGPLSVVATVAEPGPELQTEALPVEQAAPVIEVIFEEQVSQETLPKVEDVVEENEELRAETAETVEVEMTETEVLDTQGSLVRPQQGDRRGVRRTAGKRRGPGGHQAQKRHAQRQSGARASSDSVSSQPADSGDHPSGDE